MLFSSGARMELLPARRRLFGAPITLRRSALTLATASCHDPGVESAPDAYEREILAFRAAREARYRSENGWLTLVERIPLEVGDNETPIGAIAVGAGGDLDIDIPSDLEVAHDDVPVSGHVSVELPGPPPELEPVVFTRAGRRYEIVRRPGDRISMRVRDPEAPARLAFAGVPVYPIDPAFRVKAEFERLASPAEMAVEMSDGEEDVAQLVGDARFALPGSSSTHALRIFNEASTGRFYVPFGDATNREETYGGGRFLYGQEDGGSLVLDFNRACNPPCAFNPLVACPLPPPANRLTVPIRAGERLPRGR
jgi:hypothetical protein